MKKQTRFKCREKVKYFAMGMGMAVFIVLAMVRQGTGDRYDL